MWAQVATMKKFCTAVLLSGLWVHPAWAQGTSGSSAEVERAATAPLSDLNLLKQQIPLALLQAQKAPYTGPTDFACEALQRQIAELDVALPPDVDALSGRDKSLAEDAAVAVVQGTVGSLIPFRSWVRKLSGAERRSKAVASAVAAGTARRSFLKGYALSKGCGLPKPPPATEGCKVVNDSDDCSVPAELDRELPASSGDPPPQ
jgi:hypothetical protein